MTAFARPPSATRVALQAVVCLDGSQRSADALAPALALATRRGETISVVALERDAAVHDRIVAQLAAHGLEPSIIVTVDSRSQMVETLRREAHGGATPVLSAFGRWDTAGRLFGILGELVRADVARVLAVGPGAVDPPAINGCLVVATDGVCSIDPIIEATNTFVIDTTPRVVLAQMVPPAEPGVPLATGRNTAKFRRLCGVPVEAAAITGVDVSQTIADVARRDRASLIIVRSWHRFSSQQPPSASSSLSIVAAAPCPVLIVN